MTDVSVCAGQSRMQEWTDSLPDQIEEAWRAVVARHWPHGRAGTGPMLLGGMGGSAMAGHLSVALLADELRRPAMVRSEPALPGWVDAGARVLVSSYSGDTWEALALWRAAQARGAALGAITSGGELRREAESAGCPWFELPPGFQPRAALGWLFVPCLAWLDGEDGERRTRLGAELGAAVSLMREEVGRWNAGAAFPDRDPFALAEALDGRSVRILSPGPRSEPVALRWKNQILENAEQGADVAAFPEAAHNEIMGWEFLASSSSAFVLLEDVDASAGHRRTCEAAAEELVRLGASLRRVAARGETALARMLSDVLLGDRVSLELARRRGLDPVPVEAIARLKTACRKEREG